MHRGVLALAIASLASFIMGALTVITDWLARPIPPAYFLIGGAALCGALFETVRLMTRPDRHRVTRAQFHARSRATSWDPSEDREARTARAAFLADPPVVRRVGDYGTPPIGGPGPTAQPAGRRGHGPVAPGAHRRRHSAPRPPA